MIEPLEQNGSDFSEKDALKRATAEYLERIRQVLDNPGEATALARQLALERRELTEIGERDPLTNLYNRRGFEAQFKLLLRRHKRSFEKRDPLKERPLSLGSFLFVDLDHFSAANDTASGRSHEFGDRALRETTNLLTGTLRPEDIAFRYGGEEIVIFLADSPIAGAIGVSERIRKEVNDHTAEQLDGYTQTVSIGVAQIPDNTNFYDIESFPLLGNGGVIEATIKEADSAMYFAKESGRNRTGFRNSKGANGVLDPTAVNGSSILYQLPAAK